jgi:hypothetical protein
MKDENGKEMSEEQILEEACDLLANVCCLLFELESDAGIAAACFADSTLRYTQAILKGHDPRLSEEFLYEQSKGKENV